MPAKSKAQQNLMGMVHAAQKGAKPASRMVAQMAHDMPADSVTEFASTPTAKLPKRVGVRKSK